jgi:hypothetical protein
MLRIVEDVTKLLHTYRRTPNRRARPLDVAEKRLMTTAGIVPSISTAVSQQNGNPPIRVDFENIARPATTFRRRTRPSVLDGILSSV